MLLNYDEEIGTYFYKLENRDRKQQYQAIEKSNHVV